MKMEIYHQLGRNFRCAKESQTQDGTGEGLILAPRYMERKTVRDLPLSLKQKSIFDPQFFVPDVARGSLATYDFFPCLCNDIDECSRKCVNFQLHNNFRYIVIPTQFEEGMQTGFIERQLERFINPFLNAIANIGTNKDVLLQLVVTREMLIDKDEKGRPRFPNKLLNIITGIRRISGVYLIFDHHYNSQQIKNIGFLTAALRFINGFAIENEMDVILGYLNTEAILYSIAGPKIVTIGSMSATRKFKVKYFEEKEEGEGGFPQARSRIYFPTLLQWITPSRVAEIAQKMADQRGFVGPREYQSVVTRHPQERKKVYLHHLLAFSRQLRIIGDLEGKERFLRVRTMMEKAVENFALMDSRDIELNPDNNGSHLKKWLKVAREFGKKQGWE